MSKRAQINSERPHWTELQEYYSERHWTGTK